MYSLVRKLIMALKRSGLISMRSFHGKFLSAQPDGRAEWNRNISSEWEFFHIEVRHGGKITLKGAHGMYVSAQPDGSVQINRREAPPSGWEEFTVEDRGNNVICLRSCHGKYLSAQQDGTAQWNRDHAPRGGWEDIQIEYKDSLGQREPATITASMPSYVIVTQAGSSEVNGNYEFMPGEHDNRHWGTIAGHYQHTQNPEIFIAFQDCGTSHQRPEWNKWMIISKIGVLYAAHTGGKFGVPPREGVWENVESWGNPGAPGGKHPAPTLIHPIKNKTEIQERAPAMWHESIEILEAVPDKPVRFKINNPPNSNDAWVGIYQPNASDQDHGEENKRWKWLRNLDVNNASFPKQSKGNLSIRVFSDGGFSLHDRKDFVVEPKQEPFHNDANLNQEVDIDSLKSTITKSQIALFVGLCLLIPGVIIFVLGLNSRTETTGMVITGAIFMGIGLFTTFVSTWVWLSSNKKYSSIDFKRPQSRWPKIVASFAVLVLIPGIVFLILGIIGLNQFELEGVTSGTLQIIDSDDKGDQGFIIYVEGMAGDMNNNGIHDYCEDLYLNASHSGSWISNPWTTDQYVHAPDETRQAFELEISGGGSGCDAMTVPESKVVDDVGLVKIGWACYGCMEGTTTISAEYNNGEPARMWIQNAEDKFSSIFLTVTGGVVTGFSTFTILFFLIQRSQAKYRGKPSDSSKNISIEISESTEGKPVRFKINNIQIGKDAWVGIYPKGVEDGDHGDEGVRWHWLSDINVNDISFPEKPLGHWSIRVFSDRGFNMVCREDFEILPPKERWWED